MINEAWIFSVIRKSKKIKDVYANARIIPEPVGTRFKDNLFQIYLYKFKKKYKDAIVIK